MGLPARNAKQVNELLKQAIKNSRAKRYHGAIDEILSLPTSEDQIKQLLAKIPTIHDFYEVKTIKLHEEQLSKKKTQYKMQVASKKQMNEASWKEVCLSRWAWIREAMEVNPEWSAQELYHHSLENLLQGDSLPHNRLFRDVNNKWREQKIQVQLPQQTHPDFNFEQLFLKLDLEDTLLYFDQNPDFQSFYEKLEIAAPKLHSITIPVINIKNLKSGYHFYTQTLSKLTKLTHLLICGLPESSDPLTAKGVKALSKGFSNYTESGGALLSISFQNF